jgi:hypothetical protein
LGATAARRARAHGERAAISGGRLLAAKSGKVANVGAKRYRSTGVGFNLQRTREPFADRTYPSSGRRIILICCE